MTETTHDAIPWHLAGNYRPVQDELTRFDLCVTGAIPPELHGLYLRNGPNPRSGTSPHWFMGHGMVHGVRIEGGRAVWYRNRYVRTPKLEREPDTLDPGTVSDRTASIANTHVVSHAGRIFALDEWHFPYEISGELETLGCETYGGRLTTAFTAHPLLCPETNELHFFGGGFTEPYLVYHVLDAQGELVHSAEITVPGPTMMHSFMITRDHAIFMDLPVTYRPERAKRGESPLAWDESYGARLGVLPRFGKDADVRWFDIDPCYVFHPMNAYVDGAKVVCDVCRHPTMWRASTNDFAPAYLWRWELDLARGKVSERQLDDVELGFPRIDDRAVGLRYRYGWALCRRPGSNDGSSLLVKYDLERGTSTHHDFGPQAQPGELVFVEASSGAGEDEGYALGFVYDKGSDSSDLVLLDASNVAAAPLARVHMPRRVPHGFHGSWIRGQAP